MMNDIVIRLTPLFSSILMKTTIRGIHKLHSRDCFRKPAFLLLVILNAFSCGRKTKTKGKYPDTCGRGIGKIAVDKRMPP